MKNLIQELLIALEKANSRGRSIIEDNCHYQFYPLTTTCAICEKNNYQPCPIRGELDKE